MLDIKTFRADPEAVVRRLAARGESSRESVRSILDLDRRVRELQKTLSELRAERKAAARASAPGAASPRGRELKEEIARLEGEERRLRGRLEEALAALPNLPDGSVPAGTTAAESQVVRVWGEAARPAHSRPHWEIGPALGLDVQAGARLSGSRFYVLKGALARLELALSCLMMDVQHEDHGYTQVIPPFLVGRQAMFNCGQLPKFADGVYHAPADDLYLIPTAESAMASLHQGEILDGGSLPLRYAAWSPCFRREAGSAGQDTRGILRVHQFTKCELFWFTRPETSYDDLEILLAHAEEILRRLELPYRVVLLPAGDMGFAAAKTYDIEVWLAGQGTYREISSCSNVEAFQARRAVTRYRPEAGAKPRFVHMLNGSGLAVGRTMIALLENNQQPDGSVAVPAALRPYLGGREVLQPDFAEVKAM